MLLTPAQSKKYNKPRDGQMVSLRNMRNMKHKGGLLPFLAAASIPLISGIAGGLIENLSGVNVC